MRSQTQAPQAELAAAFCELMRFPALAVPVANATLWKQGCALSREQTLPGGGWMIGATKCSA